jgi:hypothetical protein
MVNNHKVRDSSEEEISINPKTSISTKPSDEIIKAFVNKPEYTNKSPLFLTPRSSLDGIVAAISHVTESSSISSRPMVQIFGDVS